MQSFFLFFKGKIEHSLLIIIIGIKVYESSQIKLATCLIKLPILKQG